MPRRDLPLQLGDKPWQEVTASPAVERHLIKTAAPFDMFFVEFVNDDLGDELDDDVIPVLSGELDDDECDFAVPCPYCKETLLFQYHLHRPTVGHQLPPCLGFLQNGPDRTVEELNRRGQMHMEGFSGEVPSHRPQPS